MTPLSNKVTSTSECNVLINLVEASSVMASAAFVGRLQWISDSGPCKVKLSQTLVAEEVALNPLSVSILARENIATLFLHNIAIDIDLENNNSTLGNVSRDKDGLNYIDGYRESSPGSPSAIDL